MIYKVYSKACISSSPVREAYTREIEESYLRTIDNSYEQIELSCSEDEFEELKNYGLLDEDGVPTAMFDEGVTALIDKQLQDMGFLECGDYALIKVDEYDEEPERANIYGDDYFNIHDIKAYYNMN